MKIFQPLAFAFLLTVSVRSLVHSVKEWKWKHAGPIENHPVRIWDVKFAKEFNDLNETQLAMAQAVGVPPVEDRDAAEKIGQGFHACGGPRAAAEAIQEIATGA